MASRRSHAALDSKLIESELRVPWSGTYIMKPTASCEAAQLWVRANLHPYSSPTLMAIFLPILSLFWIFLITFVVGL